MIRLLEVKVGGAAFERFVEIRADVFDGLKPYRDSQEARIWSGLRCDRTVGQRCRVLDQGFGAPQRHRMTDELARVGHSGRCRVATHDLEGKYRSGACHLAAHNTVGVASGQAGKVHHVHRWMHGEPLCDQLGTGLLSAHAHRQCLQPAMQQVAGQRMKNASGNGPHPSEPRCHSALVATTPAITSP